MKLQISFDQTDIEQALELAHKVKDYADIIEVGSLLIYKYGCSAINTFKENFPDKIILADAKIIDRAKDAISIFASCGADWITVLSGANKNVIQAATITAHELGKKVMLDFIDSTSMGQSALEAKALGVDAIVLHKQTKDSDASFAEVWEMVKGNTSLPIYIHTSVDKENISEILSIGSSGIILSNLTSENLDNELMHTITDEK